MKNILVPTDFSETAENAFRFAQDLAALNDAKVTAAHFFVPAMVGDMNYPPLPDPLAEWQGSCESRLAQFVRQNHSHPEGDVLTQTEVVQVVEPGFPSEEIVRHSATPEVDLVVMGTTGESGWLKKLFGSVSAQVAQQALCPVLLVPNETKFRGFKNVLYASNYEDADEAMLQQAANIAGLFGAHIHFLHVLEMPSPNYSENSVKVNHFFKKISPAMSFQMAMVQSDTPPHAMEEYARQHKVDLVVMATRHRGFIENLLHKSMTKTMAFNTHIPLMVMHFDD